MIYRSGSVPDGFFSNDGSTTLTLFPRRKKLLNLWWRSCHGISRKKKIVLKINYWTSTLGLVWIVNTLHAFNITHPFSVYFHSNTFQMHNNIQLIGSMFSHTATHNKEKRKIVNPITKFPSNSMKKTQKNCKWYFESIRKACNCM